MPLKAFWLPLLPLQPQFLPQLTTVTSPTFLLFLGRTKLVPFRAFPGAAPFSGQCFSPQIHQDSAWMPPSWEAFPDDNSVFGSTPAPCFTFLVALYMLCGSIRFVFSCLWSASHTRMWFLWWHPKHHGIPITLVPNTWWAFNKYMLNWHINRNEGITNIHKREK